MPREGFNSLAQYDEQELQEAEIVDYATKEDIAYILVRINAITTSQAMAGTPLAQMATLPSPTSTPSLIVGGPKPEGYLCRRPSPWLPHLGFHRHDVVVQDGHQCRCRSGGTR